MTNLRIGLAVTGLFVVAALLSIFWTPYDVAQIDIQNRLLPPSAHHILGTDQLGRDVLSLLMAGARSSLLVAALSTFGALVVGTVLGLWAASAAGVIDAVIMRICDVTFAFPALVLAILIGAVWGAGLYTAALAIGIFNIPVFARVARAQALKIWPEPYILAAQLTGKGRTHISLEHILPQLTGLLMTQSLIQMSFSVAAEAGLSYVGLGIVPPETSWGRMIAESQTLILQAPLQILVPCLAIVLLVFGLNRLSEGVQEKETEGRDT